jgi:hypothetical protein
VRFILIQGLTIPAIFLLWIAVSFFSVTAAMDSRLLLLLAYFSSDGYGFARSVITRVGEDKVPELLPLMRESEKCLFLCDF